MNLIDILSEITSGTIHEAIVPIVDYSSEIWQTIIQPFMDGGDYGCCECCMDAACCYGCCCL